MLEGNFCSAIIVASGRGSRFSKEIPKQFVKVNGKCILSYTIDKFQKSDIIDEIVIVTLEEYRNFVLEKIVNFYVYTKVAQIVVGGDERQNSVYGGLKAISQKCNLVFIHDGVRPLIDIESIDKIGKETLIHKSCILGVKVKDTIKVSDEKGFVKNTPDRNVLWQIQTPQCFCKDIILKSHENAISNNLQVTDDSMMVEELGIPTKIVEGKYENIKITTPQDLELFKILYDTKFRLK